MRLLAKYNSYSALERNFRCIFIDKLNLKNSYAATIQVNGLLFIDLKALDDFDSARLLAAMFLLKLLTGLKPYVVRFGLFQTFRERDYDVLVQVNLRKQNLYFFLDLLAYDVLPFVAKADCRIKTQIRGQDTVVGYTISDLNCLRVVETHSVFFKWHDKLNVKLFFPTTNISVAEVFLGALKVL